MFVVSLYGPPRQEFTKCPFRVVDEINQGMDAVNERKVRVRTHRQPLQTLPSRAARSSRSRKRASGCAGCPSRVTVRASACGVFTLLTHTDQLRPRWTKGETSAFRMRALTAEP